MHRMALLFRISTTGQYVFLLQAKSDIENGRSVPPTKRQKLAYAGLGVVLPYIISKAESWLTLSNDISPATWKDKLQRLMTNAENIFSILSLLNFLVFLVQGRYIPSNACSNIYRYRSITDRILKLRLLPLTKSQRHHLLSYEFLNRQLTWTSLTEFLLFILPLILPSYRRLRRRLVRVAKSEGPEVGKLAMLPDRFCAICFSQGREGRLITNPYCGDCGHAYCYSCLVGEVAGEEGDGWACLRCGKMIQRIKRWEELREDEETVIDQEVDANNDHVEDGSKEVSQSEGATPEDEDEVESESDEEENLFTRR